MALSYWNASSPDARFVFISAAEIYAESDGGIVAEGAAHATSGVARATLAAEAAVRARGGSVLRFGRLYHIDRGAHADILCAADGGGGVQITIEPSEPCS